MVKPLVTPVLEVTCQAPDWLSTTAKQFFIDTYPTFRTYGTERDLPLYTQLCVAYGLAVDSASELNGKLLVNDGSAGKRKNPLFQVWRESTSMFNALASKFQMSPADRQKALNEATTAQSTMAQLLLKAQNAPKV